MSSDAGSASGNGGNSGIGSGNPGQVDIEALVSKAVNEALNKAVPAIIARVAPKMIESHLESVARATQTGSEKPTAAEPADGGGDGKLTVKVLGEQLEALRKQLRASEERGTAAEAKAKEAGLRSVVLAEMHKHLGADNPMVAPLMDSLYGVHKRFDQDAQGRPVVKFQRDGYEDVKPLGDGFKELLAGELKAYVPNPAGRLPPSRVPGAQGQPWQPAQPQGDHPGQPWLRTVARALAEHRPEAAAALEAVAQAPLPPERKG